MNLNLGTNACDPARLEQFLSGALSDAQESDVTAHLDACEHCRQALNQKAAGPEEWMEAGTFLKPGPFDTPSGEMVSATESARQPLQIQNVLNALGPTDDPAMLGRLGGYEVAGVIGAGGMGVVLKAVDKSLDRTVAIKVLSPHLAASGAARQRFAREAKAAAAVLHPNVIAIHSVSNDQALPYLVMPYIRGASLQKRLDSEGPLALQEILRIGSQIAAGLAAAHAQGLVHRDIKPANILLEEGVERLTITDFGLARAVDDATITRSGVIAGTPLYMSPEQARGESVDQRSDLFSVGSVLYALCTGRPPFRAETAYGVMRRITDDEPRPIREINPEIPAWLCAIIARLMSKKAVDRFESAEEVRELLEDCLIHLQDPATMPLPAPLASGAAGGRWSFHSPRKGILAMIGTFSFALLGMVCWQATDPPDIAGTWSSENWGQVVLKETDEAEYAGTFSETIGEQPGKVEMKWSRIERRFNGTWREGEEGQARFGELSVRLVDGKIRGAYTTDRESKINPGTPKLADLMWVKADARQKQFGKDVIAPTQPAERPEDQNKPDSSRTKYADAPLPDAKPLSEQERAAATLEIVYSRDTYRRRVPCFLVSAGGQTLVVTPGPATIAVGGGPAFERAYVHPLGKAPVEVEYDSRSTPELFVYRVKGELDATRLEETASVSVGDSVTALRDDLNPFNFSAPPRDHAIVVGVNGTFGPTRGAGAILVSLDRQTAWERPAEGFYPEFDGLIQIDRTFPVGTPFYKDGKLAGLVLVSGRYLGEKTNKSLLVPGERIVELVERIETDTVESIDPRTPDSKNDRLRESSTGVPPMPEEGAVVIKPVPLKELSKQEKAATKLVFVFFQDESRRAVPCLLVDAGGQTFAICTGPATLTSTHAIDRSFVEVPGQAPIPVDYDTRSTHELFIHRTEDNRGASRIRKLDSTRLEELATISRGDSISALKLTATGIYREEATVVALDRSFEFKAPHGNYKHRFGGLIQVDGVFREGTPVYKDGKLVGLTLLGSRFLGKEANISYVVPAERIVDLLKVINARAGVSPDKNLRAHDVPFELGASMLRGGDGISIKQVRGTANTIKTGHVYEITGTYRLASHDKATLAVYITNDGSAQWPLNIPLLASQSMAIESGEGTFTLTLDYYREGKPHVSFYPKRGGEGFGHVYFGTGDSVLKKGWWEDQPDEAESQSNATEEKP